MSVRDYWVTRSELSYAQYAGAQMLGDVSSPASYSFSSRSTSSRVSPVVYTPLVELNSAANEEYSFGNGIQLDNAYAAANDFLENGTDPAGTPGVIFQECFDSSACGSGFACIGGECVFDFDAPDAQGAGSTSACGYTPTPDQPCTRGRVGGGGSGSGCLITTAGDCGGQQDRCCGRERCCRFTGTAVVCGCGKCPWEDGGGGRCSGRCDRYSKANGEELAGCSGKTCGECAECSGGICVKRGGSACYCEGKGCAECNVCGEDGSCTVPTDDRGRTNCLGCVDCAKCGKTNSHCNRTFNPSTGLPYTKAEQRAKCLAGITCDNDEEEDPCLSQGECQTITVQGGGDAPACPEGYACRQSGSGSIGGQSFALYEQCNTSGIPDYCNKCGVAGDGECGECEICNEEDGECIPDPACEEYWYQIGYTRVRQLWFMWSNIWPFGCGAEPPYPYCEKVVTDDPFGSAYQRATLSGQTKNELPSMVLQYVSGSEESIPNGCSNASPQCNVTRKTAPYYNFFDGDGNYLQVPNFLLGTYTVCNRQDYCITREYEREAGVVTGYGNTLDEAIIDAESKLPS